MSSGLILLDTLDTPISGFYDLKICDPIPDGASRGVANLCCNHNDNIQVLTSDNGKQFIRKTDFIDFYDDWHEVAGKAKESKPSGLIVECPHCGEDNGIFPVDLEATEITCEHFNCKKDFTTCSADDFIKYLKPER